MSYSLATLWHDRQRYLPGMLAVAFSAYLTWAELFKIDAICQWCVASAIVTLAIAVLATLRALGAPLHQRALS